MPKLYLLRHAQAESAFNLSDKDRPLTPHGIEQARRAGQHLKDIDVTYCSAAARTQMTLDAIIHGGANIQHTEILDKLYNSPADILMETIQQSNAKNILLIAHNPGIHQLAACLAQEENDKEKNGKEGNDKKLNHLMSSYSPASLSIFNCSINTWSDLTLRQNELIDLITQD